MTELHYQNNRLQLIPNESILDCLLRHEIDYPHSCCSGICQACLIKTNSQPIEPTWQEGLPDTLKSQGYILACQAKPTTTINLNDPNAAECEQEAMIIALDPLTHNVVRLKLFTEHLEYWIPGQYLNLINSNGISRSYSIANLPAKEGYIELHIKLKENGLMSEWLQNTATTDTIVRIRGPFGKCYYINPEHKAFDMLLAGTGTGLAPLIAIVKSALSKQHQGKITLIHGGYQDSDIYYAEELKTLASFFDNFDYLPCVLKGNGLYTQANIVDATLSHLSSLSTTIQVYVCGPKETINPLKTRVFLAGVPSAKLFSDPFL